MRRRKACDLLTDRQREQIVAFLRDWLPREAALAYRLMIRENPSAWWHDPHFANGLILQHALRGNGISEGALGIRDLTPFWPELLARAIAESEPLQNAPNETNGKHP